MSISLYCCNARFRCTTFNYGFNQNPRSSDSFQFPNHHQFLDFSPNYRLSAVVDHKRSPIFTIHSNKYGDAAIEKEGFSDAGNAAEAFTCVMKFGGSSLASAERMREVAHLILCFPEERPIIVLSALGKTTNNLIRVRSRAKSV